jgi:tRNA(Ile)-lysidine synthase
MRSLHPFETRLAASWPPEAWRDVTVLLAVSGGGDSVALLRAMVVLRRVGEGRLVAGHLNHHLRGDASDADEAFVAELCSNLGVPCEIGHVSGVRLAESTDGLESAARAARYAFLEQVAARLGARYVVTAHTADDQAETILHRIVRGTGIAGLAGMARVRRLGPATLIRPLLGTRRRELLDYLADLGQPYRADASNADARFTRNRLRHELLPDLAARFNPGVVEALLRLGVLAGEAQALVSRLVDDLAAQCVDEQPSGGVLIRAEPLAGQPRYLLRELLIAVWQRRGWPRQAMGYVQWDLLADMLSPRRDESFPARQVVRGGVTAEITGQGLRLEPPKQK